jgi:hypothetical protein
VPPTLLASPTSWRWSFTAPFERTQSVHMLGRGTQEN